MKNSFCAFVLSFISIGAIFAAPAPGTLTGLQGPDEVVVAKGTPVVIKGKYEVPKGKKLTLAPGARLYAEENAVIEIKGDLIVDAETLPVVIAAKGKKPWTGVTVSGDNPVTLTGLQVFGAGAALRVTGPGLALKSCVFSKNDYGAGIIATVSVLTVNNCTFADNGTAARVTAYTATFSNNSFLRNGRGVTFDDCEVPSDYVPTMTLTHCRFTGGGVGAGQSAGVSLRGEGNRKWVPKISASYCIFADEGCAVYSELFAGEAKFNQCYWGQKSLRSLKSRGADATMLTVKDARRNSGKVKVDWSDFLSTEPSPCGSKVISEM